MYRQTHDFFIKFLKNFRYQIPLEERRVKEDFKNDIFYAFGWHSEESEYSDIEQKNYHLLWRRYTVPSLYSTFSSLIHTFRYSKLNGDTIEKLDRPVT